MLGKADEVLPLASSHGGKVFHVVRSSFVDSLDVSMKACHSQLSQVSAITGYLARSPVFFFLFDWRVRNCPMETLNGRCNTGVWNW